MVIFNAQFKRSFGLLESKLVLWEERQREQLGAERTWLTIIMNLGRVLRYNNNRKALLFSSKLDHLEES